jgi:hypothetical protein
MSAVVSSVDVVDEVDQEIARLQALIRAQQSRRNDHVSISRLSDEALILVFLYVLGVETGSKDPQFMHVCSRWRRVSLANPSLWSVVELWPLPRFGRFVARAKEAALTIHAPLSMRQAGNHIHGALNLSAAEHHKTATAHLKMAVALLQHLVGGSRHLRQVTLLGSGGCCRSVMACMRFPRPELRFLSIHVEEAGSEANQLHADYTPSLKSLRVKNFSGSWHHTIGACLVHLSIDNCAAKIQWSVLRMALQKTFALQTCRLVDCISDELADIDAVTSAPFTPTTLLALHEVVLRGLSVGVAYRWFEDFIIPPTCAMDLQVKAFALNGAALSHTEENAARAVFCHIGDFISIFSQTGETCTLCLTRRLLSGQVKTLAQPAQSTEKLPAFTFQIDFNPQADCHERLLCALATQMTPASLRTLDLDSHIPLSPSTWSVVCAAVPELESLHIYGWSGVVLLRLLATRRKRDEPVLLPKLETLIVQDMNLRPKLKTQGPEMSYAVLHEALHMRAAVLPVQTLRIAECYYVSKAALDGL